MSQKPLDQKPLPAVKVNWIARELVPERVIEQLGVGGRILVEFRSLFVVSSQF
jgi:hypothetical protein